MSGMKRKPVMIAVTTIPPEGPDVVYVLANDGTIWWQITEGRRVWRRMRELPQDEPEGEDQQ